MRCLKKNSKKKAFTLVELLVVIAILAVLAGVSIVGYLGFTEKARRANDEGVVTQVNRLLQASEALYDKPKTMHDALNVAKENGLVIEKLTPNVDGNDFLWNEDTNRFSIVEDGAVIYPEDVTLGDNLKNWKVVDKYEPETPYSQYLRDNDFTGGDLVINNVKTGLDLGDNKETFTINYSRLNQSKQEVKIRTNNSTANLSVNTNSDIVNHYGKLGKLEVKEVPFECYYEYGKTVYANIHKGKVTVKPEAKISIVHAKNDVTIAKETAGIIEKIIPQEVADAESKFNKSLEGLKTDSNIMIESVEKTVEQMNDEVQQAIEDAAFADSSVSQDELLVRHDNTIEYMTLQNFRNKVNAGELVNSSAKLMSDVDLDNVDHWTPIGTKDHAFKGKFDGNNKSIKNLTLKGKGYLGLFGCVDGVANASYAGEISEYSKLWHDNQFDLNPILEEKYTTVIKNINFYNVNINTIADNDGVNRYAGALAAHVKNAYISNIDITSSNINVHKYSGSLIGHIEKSVMDNLTNTSSVKTNFNITGVLDDDKGVPIPNSVKNSGNDGGLIGRSKYSVIMNSVNNAEITIGNGYGGYGGIVGFGEPSVFYNNTNNSDIILTRDDSGANYVGGINGYTTAASLHVNSINNGDINFNTDYGKYSSVGGIQGYASNNPSRFYNCINNGNVSGSALYLGGIVGMGHSAVKNDPQFVSCLSLGKLNNTYESGKVNQFNAAGSTINLANDTFETVNDLAKAIETSSDKYVHISLENIVVKNINGTLTLPSYVSSFVSTNKIADKIVISNPSSQISMEINVPDMTFDFAEDYSNLSLKLSGRNNEVTVADTTKFKTLSVIGENSTVNINGSDKAVELMDRLVIGGNGTVATIGENTLVGGVSFSGSGTITLNNHGVISKERKVGNSHTLSSVGGTKEATRNIIVNNYGIIEAKSPVDANAREHSYAVLFYDNCEVTFNAYNGSKVISNHPSADGNYLVVVNSKTKLLTINYEDGAIYSIKNKSYPDSKEFTWDKLHTTSNLVVKKGI